MMKGVPARPPDRLGPLVCAAMFVKAAVRRRLAWCLAVIALCTRVGNRHAPLACEDWQTIGLCRTHFRRAYGAC